MDNTVMIQAGDLIDSTIGVTMGFSTLTACAFGQVFSDVSGVAFGGTVEAAALKLGLAVPVLTTAQRSLPLTRFVGTMGGICGVVAGCLLAMVQLLFKDTERDDNVKTYREIKKCFEHVLQDEDMTIGAERSSLFLLENDEKHLFSVAFGNEESAEYIRIPSNKGIVGKTFVSGKALNIPDAYEVSYFASEVDRETGFRTKSILSVPIFEHRSSDRVVAVVQFINKRSTTGEVIPFTEEDVESAKQMCHYISMFKPIIDGLVGSEHHDKAHAHHRSQKSVDPISKFVFLY